MSCILPSKLGNISSKGFNFHLLAGFQIQINFTRLIQYLISMDFLILLRLKLFIAWKMGRVDVTQTELIQIHPKD